MLCLLMLSLSCYFCCNALLLLPLLRLFCLALR